MNKFGKYALVAVLVAGFVWTSVQIKRSELKGGNLFVGKGKIEIRSSGRPMTGRKAPGFSLMSIEGRRVALSDFKRQPVLLCVWASWNPPSRSALILTPALEAKYKDKGLNVITINQGDNEQQVKAIAKAMKFTSVVLLDEDGSVSAKYGAERLPTMVLIGKDLKVAWHKDSFMPMEAETLERKICDALGVEYSQGFGQGRTK